MNELLMTIVAGIEVIFMGSEMVLDFMNNTEIFGISLLIMFYGYIFVKTIIDNFFETENEDPEPITINEMVFLDNEDEEEIDFNELA